MSSGERLFNAGKVPVFCDAVKTGVEKRRGEEVTVKVVTLRVQPFTDQVARAIDDGLSSISPGVRGQLFSSAHPEAKTNVGRVNFAFSVPRQQLTVFASTDTEEPAIVFDQCLIKGMYARKQKDVSGWALVFNIVFGPCGARELEYLDFFFRTQRAITFLASEPSMAFDAKPVVEEGSDADVKARRKVKALPPMFDTDPDGKPVEDGEDAEKPSNVTDIAARQKIHSHAKGRKRKRSDDTPSEAVQ